MMKGTTAFLAIFILIYHSTAALGDQRGLHYPHDSSNDISCDSCHFMDRKNPPAWMQIPFEDIDDTYINNLCRYCHNGSTAPDMETHSSLSTSAQYHAEEGGWAIECRDCHYPHTQRQFIAYGSLSYATDGVSSALDNDSLTMTGADWETDQFAGFLLIPNLSQSTYMYKITANTADTISVESAIDESRAAAGNSFAVFYGKLIRDRVFTPNSGWKTVRFFAFNDSNSFADGDDTYDGICEVCHTQTTHFRNDGTGWDNESGSEGDLQNHENLGGKAATDCIDCHSHETGFGHGGGSGSGCGTASACHGLQDSHPTHVEEGGLVGVVCDECHDTENFPLFKDGQGKATTTACDNCHGSAGAAAVAKNFWDNDGSSYGVGNSWAGVLGEANFCGSCHDATPGNTRGNDSGTDAVNIMGDNDTYGFMVTGHGLTSGYYPKMYYQETGDTGNPAADQVCSACHDLTASHFNDSDTRLKAGFTIEQTNDNCNQCHPPGAVADAAPELYYGSDAYETAAHGGRLCSDCHDVHGLVVGAYPAMARNSGRALCLSCHYSGNPDNAPVPAEPPAHHDTESSANCTDCHNPHDPKHGGGSGNYCIDCHGHDLNTNCDPDRTAPWSANDSCVSLGVGSYKSHSTHTENDSDDRKGPFIYCNTCHDINNFPYFNSGNDSNNDSFVDLGETDVCDACHSPGGSYNGVNDPLLGAKNLWATGAYTGIDLSLARDAWCAGCHDEAPSVITGIAAPNVIGNESAATEYSIGYGYYKTGHGLPSNQFYPFSGQSVPGAGQPCLQCHDARINHLDGIARTYEAEAAEGADNDYQNGYRLQPVNGNLPMNIPLNNYSNVSPGNFRLCFRCHDSSSYTDSGSTDTNFRENINAHEYHLGDYSFNNRWDSDWDGVADSQPSCLTCHNVHGSTQLSMIRDGKLIGREPGFSIYYYNDSVSWINYGESLTPKDVRLVNSTGTAFHAGTINANICTSCHGSDYNGGDSPYFRVPNDYAAFNDADEDGIKDGADNCAVFANPDQNDSDSDGLGDVCDLCPDDPGNTNDLTYDNDSDGIADSCDTCPHDALDDDDEDGLCADVDTCADDSDNDIDGDGICGGYLYSAPKTGNYDNCPAISNPSQADEDGDGVGNACDNCIYAANSAQEDSDGDSIGDACDASIAKPAVDGGTSHSIALDDDGNVWTFGDNSLGQLGNNDSPNDSAVPVQVNSLSGISMIAAGANHNIALRNDGTVWTWGSNSSGQLGIGTNDSSSDVPVQAVNMTNIIDIAAGADHCLALRSDGTVWAWGLNSNGQLGDNSTTSSSLPVQVRVDDTTFLSGVVEIGAHHINSFGIKSGGILWGWGNGQYGQLGTNKDQFQKVAEQIENIADVTEVAGGAGAGYYFTVVMKNDATVWAFGGNGWGQLGDGSTTGSSTPVQVKTAAATYLTDVTAISSLGNYHTIAVKSDGTVWGWGRSSNGQLGTDAAMPETLVYARQLLGNDSLALTDGVAVGAGNLHSLVLKSDGRIWSTGQNTEGRLGHANGLGSYVNKAYPVSGFEAGDFPNLSWTGESNYAADGVHPDSALEGGNFVFRVSYTQVDNAPPSTIQVWVDRNDSSVFDAGEKFAMVADNDSDNDYTDGKIYTRTLVLDYVGDGSLDYRFSANDGDYDADGDPVTSKTVAVISDTPALNWVGAGDYLNDGVNPNAGVDGSDFEFRITYSDAGNDSPAAIEVWVDVNDSGIYDAGEKYSMTGLDGNDTNFINGKIYTRTLALNYVGDGSLDYRFDAFDGTETATGSGTDNDTVVVTSGVNTAPTLSWVNDTADYAADGVDPDSGPAGSYFGSNFTFRVIYTDAEDNVPAPIQVWVDLNDSGVYDASEKFTMTEEDAGDTNRMNGKIYTRTIAPALAGDSTLSYRFSASDGTETATGDPVGNSTISLTAATNVAKSGGYDYNTISAAYTNTAASGTILVANGTYDEKILWQSKIMTIVSVNGPESTIIDGTGGYVIYFNSAGASTLDGFTVTGSSADGGIVTNASQPTIANCIITGNAGGATGGGFKLGSTTITIRDSIISNNSATSGGGIYMNSNSITMTDTVITGNTATNGAAIFMNAGLATVTNTVIANNTASNYAGGVYMQSVNGATSFTNTVFLKNHANAGGVIYGNGMNGTFKNCTFRQNRAVSGGGGICYACSGTLTIRNSIAFENTASSGLGHNFNRACTGSTQNVGTLSSSLFDTTNSTFMYRAAFTDGGGNLTPEGDYDPAFADNDSYYLTGSSTDVIDQALAADGPSFDIDNDSRVPVSGKIDMGADEYVP